MTELTYKKDPIFDQIVKYVVKIEGGFVNDPRDPGGPTKFGIAWNYNHDVLKALFGYSTWQEMKDKLTQEQAKEIYFRKYYVGSGAAGLTDEGLAFIHFDCAVNQGVGIAKKFLETLSKNPKHYDGRGNKNQLLFLGLYLEYIAKRLDRYTDLRQDLRRAYLSGWVNRIIHVIENTKELEGF